VSIYTYVVDHEDKNPRVGADEIINGGKLRAVMFDDAIKRLEEAEDFIRSLRDETTCEHTKYSIDDFLN